MFHESSMPFAKIVRDLDGRDHILIEGRVISLQGEQAEVNAAVDVIVTALRNSVERGLVLASAQSADTSVETAA